MPNSWEQVQSRQQQCSAALDKWEILLWLSGETLSSKLPNSSGAVHSLLQWWSSTQPRGLRVQRHEAGEGSTHCHQGVREASPGASAEPQQEAQSRKPRMRRCGRATSAPPRRGPPGPPGRAGRRRGSRGPWSAYAASARSRVTRENGRADPRRPRSGARPLGDAAMTPEQRSRWPRATSAATARITT